MEELIGFAASNHRASKILAVLDSKGAMDGATIAKTTRIVGANKSIEELVNKKLIENKSGRYELTETGRLVSRKLRGV